MHTRVGPNGRDRSLLDETDGSAADASFPARPLGPRRAFPPLAACTQSKSGGTGKRKAATARPIAYRYVMSPLLRSAFFDHLAERSLDLRKRRAQGRTPGVNHDVPLRSDIRPLQPERFPDTALDAVTHHSPTDGTRYGKPQPRCDSRRVRTRQAERSEQGTGKADTVIIDGSKFGCAQDPRSVRELQRAAGGGFSCWPSRTGQLSRR